MNCFSSSSVPRLIFPCIVIDFLKHCRSENKINSRFPFLCLRANRSEGQSWWQPQYPCRHCDSAWRTADKFKGQGWPWTAGVPATSEDLKQAQDRGDREMVHNRWCLLAGRHVHFSSPTAFSFLRWFCGRWVDHLYYLKTVRDKQTPQISHTTVWSRHDASQRKKRENNCK